MIGTKALQVHIYPPMQRNGRVEYEAVLKSTSYLMYLVDMVRKPRRTCSYRRYEYKVPRNIRYLGTDSEEFKCGFRC